MKTDNTEWISVKDRLPEEEKQVIGYIKGHHCPVQMLGSVGIPEPIWYCWTEDIDIEGVTHWMPLPEPPKP